MTRTPVRLFVPRVSRALLVLLVLINMFAVGCEHEETPAPSGPPITRPAAEAPAPMAVVSPDAGRAAVFQDGATTLRDGTRVALLAEGIEVRRPASAAALTLSTSRVGRGRSGAGARDAAWTAGADASRM